MRDWTKAEWIDPTHPWTDPLPVSEYPERLLVDFATRCNLRCPMCPVWGSDDERAIDEVKGIMGLEEARRMLDEVASDLRQLREMLHASGDFLRLIRSPILSRDQQGRAMGVLAERAGLSQLVRDFFAVVARNRRLFAIPAMIEAFLAKLAARRGEVSAQVTAAQPLSEAQLGALNEQLRRSIGSRVSIDIRVDPGLIGGLVVKLGSRMVDGSIKSKLQRLQLAMKSIA